MPGKPIETVSVIGLGYIGLPTAAAFAARGLEVVGVDISARIVDTINRGEICIVEPDLGGAVREAVAGGFLRATLTPEPADAFLIAVPTPIRGDDKRPNLSFVEAAAKSIASVLKRGDLVVLESTVPVGATEQMADWLAELRPDLTVSHRVGKDPDIRIAHCPERVLPGFAMQEITCNDRIIGGVTPDCAKAAKNLYEVFVEGECLVTDVRTAELCKLAENAFRDVNIAYANELSRICDRLDIDVWSLIDLANRHPRVNILRPGPGVGGHCIAVDPWFIVATAPGEAGLIRAARAANDTKPDWVLRKIRMAVNRHEAVHNARAIVGVLGLSFKPDIDDLRESPALHIASQLHKEFGRDLIIVEPHVHALPQGLHNAQLADIDVALAQADIVAILVGHAAFRASLVDGRFRDDQQVIDTVGLLTASTRASIKSRLVNVPIAAE